MIKVYLRTPGPQITMPPLEMLRTALVEYRYENNEIKIASCFL